MANIKDVYDESELRALNPNLRFLQEVDKRTGYRTKQMLVAPIVEQGSSELIGVIQIINNKAGTPFGTLTEEGVAELSATLAIAFKQRQKPQVVKTKYDYLIADAVLSAGEFDLASRQARKKAVDIEQVLVEESRSRSRRSAPRSRSSSACPDEPFKADASSPRPAQEPQARVRRGEPSGCRSTTRREGLTVLCLDPSGSSHRASPRTCFPRRRFSTRWRRRRTSRTPAITSTAPRRSIPETSTTCSPASRTTPAAMRSKAAAPTKSPRRPTTSW
jgi:hypothetical protein